jgi:WD40 repeat protein
LWTLINGKPAVLTLMGHKHPVNCVALSADGRYIVSGSGLHQFVGELKVWEASTGREMRTFEGHGATIRSVAISRDGARIVSDSRDMTLNVWDGISGRVLRTLKSRPEDVSSVLISPDGTLIYSCGRYSTVSVWDTRTGQPLLSLDGGNRIGSLTMTHDGKRAVWRRGRRLYGHGSG